MRDLDAVHEIARAEFGTGDAYPKFLFAQFADILADGFLVAEYDGEVVGYSVTMLDADDETRGAILSLAVRERHPGVGAENALRAASIAYLEQRSREIRPANAAPADEREVRTATAEALYRVRRFRQTDLDDVFGVELSAFGDDPYPQSLFRKLADVLGGGFLVAEEDTPRGPAVVGYLLAVLDASDPDVGWIMSVAVGAAHRGRGAGNRLMDAAEEYLRLRSCREVVLTVDPDNVPAVTLYKNRDYWEIERHDDHHGLNLSRLVMKQHAFVDVPRPRS